MQRNRTLTFAALAVTFLLAAPIPASAAFLNEADALRACEQAINRHDAVGAGRARFERDYGRTRGADGFTFYINTSVASGAGGPRRSLRSVCRARGFAQVDSVVTLPGRWDLDRLAVDPAALLAVER